MKIFNEANSLWNEKVNFIDDNNIFVGYDFRCKCSEDFGWFISNRVESGITGDKTERSEEELEDYVFDKFFVKKVESELKRKEGGLIIFRLINIHDVSKELFLHLYNYHNGYYSHGFEFKDGDEVITEGSL